MALKWSFTFKSPSFIVYPKVGETLGNWKILYAGVDERGILHKYVMQCKCGRKSIKDRKAVRQQALHPNSHWSCCKCAKLNDRWCVKYSDLFDKYSEEFMERMYIRWMVRRQARRDPNHPGCCDEWYNSFRTFFNYCIGIDDCFNLSLWVDRPDGTKPYEPGNLRFVTPKENNNNRKDNKLITTDKGDVTLMNWIAEEFGYQRHGDCNKLYNFLNARINESLTEDEIRLLLTEWLKHNNVKY